MKVILRLAIGTVFLTACNFDQDPIAGASDQVRQGKPPVLEGPKEQVKPIPKDMLVIDVPPPVSTLAGMQMKVKVSGRVLDDKTPFELSIVNMDRFDGATFDPKTGEFVWTPSKILVDDSDYYQTELIVRLSTFPTAEYPVVQSETERVVLIVHRVYDAPKIKAFTGPSELEVGRFYTMEFTVEHPESYEADDISIAPYDCGTDYQKSISYLAEVEEFEADENVSGLFHGKIFVDLSEAPALKRGSYCIGIVAYSMHGKRSNFSSRSLSVEAAIRHTVISTDEETMTVPQNEVNYFHFSISDPGGIGKLTLTSSDDIAASLPGSTLTCTSDSWSRHRLQCVAKVVTTPTTDKGKVNIKMEVENEHPYISGRSFSDTHYLRLEVK